MIGSYIQGLFVLGAVYSVLSIETVLMSCFLGIIS